MGSLVSGIAGLIEGDPTKPEENQLGTLSGYEGPAGQNATTTATNYYGGILSGDPAQVAMTLAPEISTATQGAEQQKLQNAEFGNRSGGTNSSNQSIDSNTRGTITNLEGEARQNAAAAEAGIGQNLLGLADTSTMNEASLAGQARQNQLNEIGGIATGAGQIASGLFTGGATGAAPESLNSAQIFDPGPAPNVSSYGIPGDPWSTGAPDLGAPSLPDVSEYGPWAPQ